MIVSLGAFLPLAGQAITAPRVAVRQVLDTPADRPTLIRFAFLIVLFNLIVGLSADLVLPAPEDAITISTAAAFIMHAATIFGGAGMMFVAGQMFKGQGTFDGCLKAVTWFAWVMLLAQTAMIVVLVTMPSLLEVTLIALLILSFVQLTGITMELHGFENAFLVLLGIVGAGIVFGFFMLILFAFLGVELPTAPA
ncbi:MAG: YIP1 family protein [Pseudomonadota bacterium]